MTKLMKPLMWTPRKLLVVISFLLFFAKVFKPRADAVADKNTTEEPTVVVDNEGQKAEETKPLTDELEPEDKPEPIADEVKQEDKPEPVDEDDNKKEPTPNTSF